MAFSGQYGPEALIDVAGNAITGATIVVPGGYIATVDAKGNLTITGPASDSVAITVTPSGGVAAAFTVRVEPLVTDLTSVQTSTNAAIPGLLPVPTGTDDTAAIAAVIAAAAAGKRLVAAPGASYIVTGIAVNKRLTLDMTGATITQKANTTGDLCSLTAAGAAIVGGTWDGNRTNQVATQNRGIGIGSDDCSVDGATVQNTVYTGIYAVNCNRVRINSCQTLNTGYIGIFVETTSAIINDNRITNCLVDRSTIAAASIIEGGLKVHGLSGTVTANRTLVVNCRVLMPVNPTDGTSVCIEVTYCPRVRVVSNETEGGSMGISSAGCDRSVVSSNSVYNPKTYGVELAGSRGSTVLGNTLDGNGLGTHGIILDLGNSVNSDDSAMTGNSISGFVSACIKTQAAIRLAITGNVCKGTTAGYLIWLVSGNQSTVSGNAIDGLGTGAKGVMLDSSIHCTVSGNTIFNTTEHGILLFSASIAIVNVAMSGNTLVSVNVVVAISVSGTGSAGVRLKFVGNVSTYHDYYDLALSTSRESGAGSPVGTQGGSGVGSIYTQTDGGAATTLWVKESGGTTATGWVAK